jgi:hypothetical protein
MLRQPRWRSLWQSSMTTGYDATNPRSVLRHAWNTWSWWRFMHGGPKAYQQFHASASTLARRALRGWRRWTIRTRLFVPSWQRCRIQPHWLPPLPASEPLARRRPQITSLPYLAYGRKFWKGKSGSQQELAAAAYRHDPKELQRLRRREEWEAADLVLRQEPYKLAPSRPWLRSWQRGTTLHRGFNPKTRCYEGEAYYQLQELRPAGYPSYGDYPYPPGTQKYRHRTGRSPPKARFVLCHYEQPHSWHEIRASVTSDDTSWTQWQESVISTTVGSCRGSIRWAGIQPIIASLRTQLAVLATSRRQSYRRHPQSHQRSWQPPRHRPGPHSTQPGPSQPSQPRCPTLPVSSVAGFPGFGTHATDLAALDQYIEQAAVCIQRAFRRLRRQRSSCLGSTVARPQPLTVCIQPEDEGDSDSKGEFSVADTEASQASTLLACLLLACRAFTRSSRHRRHSRRMVSIASASRAWSTSESWASRPTADFRLLHCPAARRVECAFRRRRLGLHRGCTDGTGFRLSLEP